MGFSLKKAFSGKVAQALGIAALNPSIVTGAVAAGGDLWGAYEDKMAAKAADSTTREINNQQLGLAREQMAAQEQFAKHGIRWRAEDAKAAGLHPLAALGGAGASYSPVAAILESPTAEGRQAGNMARALGAMGQNVHRAAMSTMSVEEKAAERLRIESMDLDNELKRIQIRNLSGPSIPTPTPGQPQADWQETTYPSVAYMRSPTGVVPIMPPNLAEALESDQTGQFQWVLRYRGGPNVNPVERPAKDLLPRNASGWMWNRALQEWQPRTTSQLETSGRRMAEGKHRPKYQREKIGYERFLP